MTSFDKGEEDVKTLVKALNDKPGFSRLCIYTHNCFLQLSRNRKNLDRMAEEGGFSAIINNMSLHGENSHLIGNGANALINACKVPEYAKMLGDNGAIEFCLNHLKTAKNNAAKVHVSNLLKALCDGSPSNTEKLRELGGEEVLKNALKEANKTKNDAVAASVLNVLEKMVSDKDSCVNASDDLIAEILESLKLFPSNAEVTVPAIQIICNLSKFGGEEMILKLRAMNAIKLISNAMNLNASNKQLSKAAEEALKKLSDQSDIDEAIAQLTNKSISIVEKIEIISLIGNLSNIINDVTVLERENVIEKLAKIIKSNLKLDKISEDEIKMLNSSIQAAGKVAAKSDKAATYYSKNILDYFCKLLEHKKLTPEILKAINVSLEHAIANKIVLDKALSHSKLLPLLYEKNRDFKNNVRVRSGVIEFSNTLGSTGKGLAKLSALKAIPLLCEFVQQNHRNSGMVLRCYESFISFSKNIGSAGESDVKEMVDSAMNALKNDSENIKVCEKAIEVLQALATNSQFVRDLLSSYEYSSALSKFKNEAEEPTLKDAIDELKSSLKNRKLEVNYSTEQILEKISEETAKVQSGDKCEEVLQTVFALTEMLLPIALSIDNAEELKRFDAHDVIAKAITETSKSDHSELKEDVLTNLVEIINAINSNGEYSEEWLKSGFYETLFEIYATANSKELQGEIDKAIKILRDFQAETMRKLGEIKIGSADYTPTMVAQLQKCSQITEKMNALKTIVEPDTQVLNEAIDQVMTIVHENTENEEVLMNALKLLDILTETGNLQRGYFVDKYISSTCAIVRMNPDNEMTANSLLAFLNSFDNDETNLLEIAEIKQWYFNRNLETDLMALKLHLIDKIYNLQDNPVKYTELRNNLHRLAECYDPNNSLVDLDEEPNKADIEATKMVPTFLDMMFSEEVKLADIALIKKMIQNKKIEKLFLTTGVLGTIAEKLLSAKSREERMIYLSSIIPFQTSSEVEIQNFVQDVINQLLQTAKMMSIEDRTALLKDLIDMTKDGEENAEIHSKCLDSLLTLLEMQKAPTSKAKVLAIITKMIASSDAIATEMAEGRGLALAMRILMEEISSQEYVEALSAMTMNLAQHFDTVDKMFTEKVDQKMKDIMFQYTNQKNTFHNAQRTIDLMHLAHMNLTPEQLKQWKARSRIKQLMTELCRGLGIKISVVLTKGEREVRTGDTAKDISSECRRILNEFGSSFDEAIDSNSSTKLLMWLGEAWMLRAVLMTYTFLVEKDVSARSIINAPTTIEDTLTYICKFAALWDFENKEIASTHRAVRGGISHQSVRMILDSAMEAQPCQEMDVVTKEPIGREYSLEDLIVWVKMDTEEVDTLRCFNLVLTWVMTNWNLVTITASITALKNRAGKYNMNQVEKDGGFLSIRCGLRWDWAKRVTEESGFIVNSEIAEPYNQVEIIKKSEAQGGMHIKVKISGDVLREKRRDIKDSLDFSQSNVLNGDEKDELDFFIDVSAKGADCRIYTKTILKTKMDLTFIKFNQEEDGDLYFSWGQKDVPFEKRNRFNMKELEGIKEGKESKALKKAKNAVEDNCFTVMAAGDRCVELEMENKGDRDMWVKGIKLVLCTVAKKRPADMKW